MKYACALLLLSIALQSALAIETNLITLSELDSAKVDWPKSVKATSNITVKVNFGEIVIPEGEVLPVLTITKATISVLHAGMTNQIPTAATDIVDQINDSRRHRLIVGADQYNNCRFEAKNPEELKVFHSTGIATVPMSKLPPELQKQFGYDPEKAEAQRKARAEQAARIAHDEAEQAARVASEAAEKTRRDDEIRKKLEDVPIESFPKVEGVTRLATVKADAKDYVGKDLTILGCVEIQNYYNFGYIHAADTFYSLTFNECDESVRWTNQRIFLYLRKTIGKPLIEFLSKNSGHCIALRIKVRITPMSFESNEYHEMGELVDWSELSADRQSWDAWQLLKGK